METQATSSQVASPGQSPEHWGTKSFSSAVITFLVVALIAVLTWRVLLKGIRVNLGLRVMVYLSEAAAAVGLSLVATYFDIFKKSTYIPTPAYQPDWHVPFWMSVWAAIIAYYLIVKLAAIVTKESEESRSKQLSSERDRLTAAMATLERQRSFVVRMANFARNMVNRKITRLSTLAATPKITVQQFVGQLNPSLQVQANVKLIHEFFKPPDGLNANLRLALWMKAPADDHNPDRMAIAYSWNGETEKCFSNQSAHRMRLLDPRGTCSEIVKFYSLQAKTIKIIPDCIEAARNHEFEFFYPEQKHKAASMVLYKHVFNPETQPVAVVLLLVSSVPNSFRREDEDQYRTFFDEMLTRIEMEWILLQLTHKLDQAKEVA